MQQVCGLAAIVLILSAAGAGGRARGLPELPRQSEVYVAGEGGYHTYRIPSVIVTAKGTLLAFAEGRQGSAADSGNIDLVLRRSKDGGASWSAVRVLVDNGPNSASNPCPVIDRTTGTIWLLSTRNLGTDRESDIIAGTSQATPAVWVMNSRDDGETWSTPVEITASVKATGWNVGRDRSRNRYPDEEWPAGDFREPRRESRRNSSVAPVFQRRRRKDVDAWRKRRLWHERKSGRGACGRSPDAEHEEPPAQACKLPDGGDERRRGRTLSSAHADEALIEPPAQASILRNSTAAQQDRNRLLFSNAAGSRRERLTVRVSYDEGMTWPVARVLHDGPAVYSTLTVLPDRSIGVLFERGDKSPVREDHLRALHAGVAHGRGRTPRHGDSRPRSHRSPSAA